MQSRDTRVGDVDRAVGSVAKRREQAVTDQLQ